MRVALHSTIHDGAVDAYRDHHHRIPDDLRGVFDRAGIHDWVIWRSGNRLFHLIECDDFEHAMSVVTIDPANDRWQADIGRFVDRFFGPDGIPAFAPIEQVWSLEEQRTADAR